MTASCSILEKVLIMQPFPILASAFTRAWCIITDPSPIRACLETCAVEAIKTARRPPAALIFSCKRILTEASLMYPMVTTNSALPAHSTIESSVPMISYPKTFLPTFAATSNIPAIRLPALSATSMTDLQCPPPPTNINSR